jgi:hypothetical protein
VSHERAHIRIVVEDNTDWLRLAAPLAEALGLTPEELLAHLREEA